MQRVQIWGLGPQGLCLGKGRLGRFLGRAQQLYPFLAPGQLPLRLADFLTKAFTLGLQGLPLPFRLGDGLFQRLAANAR